MRIRQKRWRAAVAAALMLIALPAAAAPPSGSAGDTVAVAFDRIGSWLARLLPSRLAAAAETPPPAPPPVIGSDDESSNGLVCQLPTCQEGELLPDLDPNG